MTPQLKKNCFFLKKKGPGVSFLLIIQEEKWPRRKNDPCLNIEDVEYIRSFHVHWKSLSVLWFNTQQRFAEQTGWSWVYRSLDYVYCHSFLDGYRGALSLSLVKVNKYSIQCSDASLDNTDHWIILFIGDKYCFSVKMCLLEDVIQGHWLCCVVIRVIQRAMLWISSVPTMVMFIFMYSIMHTASCALRLSNIKSSK